MKILFLSLISAFAFAGPDHDHPAPKIAPDFEKLKAVVGKWEGKTAMHGKEETVLVTYELTSGGTALVEKMSPGTPHEMITMYSTDGKTVGAKHYCMLGNQPEMKLKKASGNTFEFEMDGTKGITDKNEMHMHSVTIALDNDKLTQTWTNFKDGKKGDVAVFNFTKKK